MGTLYDSRVVSKRSVVYKNVRYERNDAIVIPNNLIIGTPEFVFIGVPDAVVRRYIEGVEKASKTNSAFALGLHFQLGADNPQPISFVGLNPVDYRSASGSINSNGFTADGLPGGQTMTVTDNRTGLSASGGIVLERRESLTPIFLNIEAARLNDPNYTSQVYNSAVDQLVSTMADETVHYFTKEKYGALVGGHAEGLDIILNPDSTGLRFIPLRDDVLAQRYQFAVLNGLFKPNGVAAFLSDRAKQHLKNLSNLNEELVGLTPAEQLEKL